MNRETETNTRRLRKQPPTRYSHLPINMPRFQHIFAFEMRSRWPCSETTLQHRVFRVGAHFANASVAVAIGQELD